MSDLTPIRVRGKRKGIAAERWNYGRQRKIRKTEPTSSSTKAAGMQSPSAASTPTPVRKSKHRSRELSRLEELPTEVIQSIFELSDNLRLPSTSPLLASQLKSPHLFNVFTSRRLEPIFGGHDSTPADFMRATRLMDSKFFTYGFFEAWLIKKSERLNMAPTYQEWLKNHVDVFGDRKVHLTPERQAKWTWAVLLHSSCELLPATHWLLPPRKVLSGPFTDDKIRFLNLMVSHTSIRDQVKSTESRPCFHNIARNGLLQAITEGSTAAITNFWKLGLKGDTETLRHAVINAGCDQSVVASILRSCWIEDVVAPDIDWLDTELWAWAESNEAQDHERGRWLKSLLKRCQRIVHSGSSEEYKDLLDHHEWLD